MRWLRFVGWIVTNVGPFGNERNGYRLGDRSFLLD